jgi:predicted component of type VI protein secretion system
VVGRKDNCDLRLNHKSVSKQHCVLVKTDGLLLLRDLGSTNGTRVNGQRVRRAALLPDDHLGISMFKFRVYLGPGNPPEAGHEHTQRLEPHDLADLLREPKQPPLPKRAPPVQSNPLPDIYADDKGTRV